MSRKSGNQEAPVVDINAEKVTPIPIYIGFAVLFTMFLDGFSLLGLLIGVMLPDCDKQKSAYWKFFPFWLFFKPNGFTHSIASLYLIGSLTYFLTDSYMALGVTYGYFSHLVFDFFRGYDCQFMYPRKDFFSFRSCTSIIKGWGHALKCMILKVKREVTQN